MAKCPTLPSWVPLIDPPDFYGEADAMLEADPLVPVYEALGSSATLEFRVAARMVVRDLLPFIVKVKWHYNRARPFQVMPLLGHVDFTTMESTTAHSPSYPSGHTIQASVVAGLAARSYPSKRAALTEAVDWVSQTRMMGGWHWPSDLVYANKIAAGYLG
jgi:membrane-associated phospholipid phosphatase